MSCQISTVANIADVEAIKLYLFPIEEAKVADNWLQSCEISVSPTGDIIVVARGRKVVILSAKWNSGSSTNQFQITYSGLLHSMDNIKAVLCLPVVNETKSSHVMPDWTCILVGFESGAVRFCSDSCDLLLEKTFHNENITSIKCRSQHSSRPDAEHQEEIYIQYQSNVCVIEGCQLFSTLRTCRSEFTRAQKLGRPVEPFEGDVQVKKWGFQDQAKINDAVVIGASSHGTFDHLLVASNFGGYETKYRSSAVPSNLVLGAGSRPFVGFHYAIEGSPLPILTDVAKAVATKLKSALPTWLTGTKATVDKQKLVSQQPPEVMGCRFGLCDLRRTATTIICSPDHKLAAITDDLGRVILMDALRGVTLSIFKGYRDAQCSFIEVPNDRKHHKQSKVALFLVIYCPKKGTLEIFTVQQGLKVTTFSASKLSRLVYNNYGLMGLNSASKSRYKCQFTTIFIDNSGQIKEITIPIHFASRERKDKHAHDIHVLKKLKQLLKFSPNDHEAIAAELCKTAEELQTLDIKFNLVELLLSSKSFPSDLISRAIVLLRQNLIEEDEEANNFKIMLDNVISLLDFYDYTSNIEKEIESSDDSKSSYHAAMKSRLNITTATLKKLQGLIDLNRNKKTISRVKFAETTTKSHQLLSVFALNSPDIITLKLDVDDALLLQTSETIYEKAIKSNSNLTQLEDEIAKVKIRPSDLLSLLIHYWINRSGNIDFDLEIEMNNLFNVLSIVAKIIYEKLTENEVYDFWKDVRVMLAETPHAFSALTMAILCKIITHKYESDIDDDSFVEDENAMMLSPEGIKWAMLIGKLEDISLINVILCNQPEVKCCTLPKLKNNNKVMVSLNYILQRGKGSISELMARWLAACGLDPEELILNEEMYKKCKGEEFIESEPIFADINLLKTKFPFSLSSDMILTNMCWEYALAWCKDIENLEYLKTAIKCLLYISSSHIKEGLCDMVWNTHLKVVFDTTSKLINKVGRLPKDRLCKQDSGLSNSNMSPFFTICTDFFDSYMRLLQNNFEVARPTLEFECFWEDASPSLAELALQQNSINYDLLQLHFQLSLCMEMLTTFSIKQLKPINSLFESYMTGLFFIDFESETQINWNYADSKVQSSRTNFLMKVISASMETVTVSDDNIYTQEHSKFMLKCIELATLWNLDLDALRRFQLIQIYKNGYDSFGTQILSTIRDKAKLSSELLAICGKRLNQYLDSSPDVLENTTKLSTTVTNYLHSLDDEWWCAPSTLECTNALLILSLTCISEDSQEYKIAIALADGVQTLKNTSI